MCGRRRGTRERFDQGIFELVDVIKKSMEYRAARENFGEAWRASSLACSGAVKV